MPKCTVEKVHEMRRRKHGGEPTPTPKFAVLRDGEAVARFDDERDARAEAERLAKVDE